MKEEIENRCREKRKILLPELKAEKPTPNNQTKPPTTKNTFDHDKDHPTDLQNIPIPTLRKHSIWVQQGKVFRPNLHAGKTAVQKKREGRSHNSCSSKLSIKPYCIF